jgi:hypothetical protein
VALNVVWVKSVGSRSSVTSPVFLRQRLYRCARHVDRFTNSITSGELPRPSRRGDRVTRRTSLAASALPPAPDGLSATALHQAHQPRWKAEPPRAYPGLRHRGRERCCHKLLRLPAPALAIYARFVELLE